jgi:peptidyl-prolyl cis-trans isomerase A (cyclophilin A)
VTKGLDVVQKIGKVPTGNFKGFQDVPQQPVTIESVRVIQGDKATNTKQ